MAKQSDEITKNSIGSQHPAANHAGDMLVGRKRFIDLEANSAKLRAIYTLVFISVPIFIGVTTVLASSLFSGLEQSTFGITTKEERLVEAQMQNDSAVYTPNEDNSAPPVNTTRWQKEIEATVPQNSSTGSACITFEPPLTKSTRVRYEDYVEVKPAQSDLVMEIEMVSSASMASLWHRSMNLISCLVSPVEITTRLTPMMH